MQRKLILSAKLMYPTNATALTIAVTFPVSSVTTKRTFSKLNFIKNTLKTMVTDIRLATVMILAMEQDVPIKILKVNNLFAKESPLLLKMLGFV